MIEKLIKKNYDDLNRVDAKFLLYLSTHKDLCKNSSLITISKKAGVEKDTAKRALKKIGIADELELQHILLADQINLEQLDIEKLIFDIKDTIKLNKNYYNKEFFEDIRTADRVFAYGTGNIQQSVCSELKRIFIFLKRSIFLIEGYDELEVVKDNIGEGDVLIVVSLSGENEPALECMRQSKANKAKIFSISKKGYNSMVKISDYYMQYFSNIFFVNENNVDISPLTHMFMLVDFIFLNYYKFLIKNGYRSF